MDSARLAAMLDTINDNSIYIDRRQNHPVAEVRVGN
jgi:hypothetical protein